MLFPSNIIYTVKSFSLALREQLYHKNLWRWNIYVVYCKVVFNQTDFVFLSLVLIEHIIICVKGNVFWNTMGSISVLFST